MKKFLLILTIGSALAGGAAISAKTRDTQQIAMKDVGEPRDCVSLRSIQSTKIIDDQTIDFKVTGGKTLRNNLPYSCSGLKSANAFSYHTSLSQLCSVDMIRVLETYGGRLEETAGCGLGKFQQVEPASVG